MKQFLKNNILNIFSFDLSSKVTALVAYLAGYISYSICSEKFVITAVKCVNLNLECLFIVNVLSVTSHYKFTWLLILNRTSAIWIKSPILYVHAYNTCNFIIVTE